MTQSSDMQVARDLLDLHTTIDATGWPIWNNVSSLSECRLFVTGALLAKQWSMLLGRIDRLLDREIWHWD